MASIKYTIILFYNILLVSVVIGKDYCNMPGCGRSHIGCNNNGKFSVDCPSDVRLVDINPHKEHILKAYNEIRNKVAAGDYKGLQPAVRTAEMEWDNELAFLAELKVKTCNHRTDKCQSTEKFAFAGQNTAIFSYTGDVSEYTDGEIIKKRIQNWLSELKYVDRHIIACYPTDRQEHPVGHATILINEKNTHTGCAASRFTENEFNRFIFVCFFATDNVVDEPVYTTGKAAGASCEKRSKRYPNLCFNSEKYDLDKI